MMLVNFLHPCHNRVHFGDRTMGSNIETTPSEIAQRKAKKYASKRARRKDFSKSKSVRAVSGGLPSLGKRK